MASKIIHPPDARLPRGAKGGGRRGERMGKSERRAERRGWRREKLRQGLLTDSDGSHFIRDTILRLPQPTRSPSPSPMPPTTDLIWSEPTPIQTFTSPLTVYMYIRRLLLPPSPFFFPLPPLLSATRSSVYPALVLLIFSGRRERERDIHRGGIEETTIRE